MTFPSALLGIVAAFATLAVVAVLFLGLFAMIKGGDFSSRNTNRLMRMRVALQGVAVIAIGIMMLLFYAGE